MPLIRCPSCGYRNTPDAKVCRDCGDELRLPPHLISCPHCGSINPVKESYCIWCHRKLPGPLRRGLRGQPARVVVAAAVATIVITVGTALGYYVFSREFRADAAPAPAISTREAPPADAKRAKTDASRTDRAPADAARAKAAQAATVPSQPSSARKAGERSAAVAESCAEGQAALGLCGRTQRREPQPARCTEAVAALGLCESKTIQGRE